MFDLLDGFLSLDQYATLVVVVVSALGGFIMNQMVDSKTLALLFVPAFLAGGLAAQYLFDQYDIVLASDRDANIVAISVIGMIAGLVVMILITRILFAGSKAP